MHKLLIIPVIALAIVLATALPAKAWVNADSPQLKPTVDAVWGRNWNAYNLVVATNATNWHVGTNLPIQNSGLTQWTCAWFFGCFYWDVTIRPGYETNQRVIAHEGGHILCMSWEYGNSSEECADRKADWILSKPPVPLVPTQ